MKLVRALVGLTWVGAFVWAIVALVNGSWLTLGVAVIAWVVIGLLFMAIDRSLLKNSARTISTLTHSIGERIDAGDWSGAMALSGSVVGIAESTQRREAANKQLAPSLASVSAVALVNHCILLGANARFAEAERAMERLVALAHAHGPEVLENGMVRAALLEASELLRSGPSQDSVEDFRDIALEMNESLT